MLRNNPQIAQVIEVPTSLTVCKFYVDMDMYGSRLKHISSDDVVERIRGIGMRTPEVLTRMLLHFGLIDAETWISVVNIEVMRDTAARCVIKFGPDCAAQPQGTRWHGGKGCHKFSWHFIWNILLTKNEYQTVWGTISKFLQDPAAHVPNLTGNPSTVYELIVDDSLPITEVLSAHVLCRNLLLSNSASAHVLCRNSLLSNSAVHRKPSKRQATMRAS